MAGPGKNKKGGDQEKSQGAMAGSDHRKSTPRRPTSAETTTPPPPSVPLEPDPSGGAILLSALTPGTIVGSGLVIKETIGKGGTGILSVDGKEVARKSLEHTTPVTFPEDETFDVGHDTRTGIAMLEDRYDVPFKFTGKIDNLTFRLE